MYNPSFVQISTKDGLTLPGLLFSSPKTTKAAIYLHGKGGSCFYIHDFTLQEEFYKNNIAFLGFNNRGAELIKRLTVEKNNEEESKYFGSSFEKIKECIEDIDGAVSFLEQKGFKEIFLIGNSTGANKICVYNYYKPQNKIAKYILLAGGDDTGMLYNHLGKENFYKFLTIAKEKVAKREGGDLICDLIPEEISSYQSFLDIADPDGDYNVFPFYEVLKNVKLSSKPLFRMFKCIKKPSLVVYGENDEYTWGDAKSVVNILKKYQPEFTYKIIPVADHRFQHKKKELAEVVIKWLKD